VTADAEARPLAEGTGSESDQPGGLLDIDSTRIPRIGTAARARRVAAVLAEGTPPELGLALAQLAEGRPPDDAHVVTILLAAELISARWPDVLDDYAGGRYHRPNVLALSELARRRYPPTGDRDTWVRYGPAGPPDRGVPV
jgi:hypothetical protein